MSFCVFEVDHLNLFILFSMIGCNIIYIFNGLLPKHIQVDLGRGLGTKPTPFNLFSLARLTLKFYLRADLRVLVMRFFSVSCLFLLRIFIFTFSIQKLQTFILAQKITF